MNPLSAAGLILLSLSLGILTALAGGGGEETHAWFEQVQLTLFAATIPWAVYFVWIYAHDLWFKTWFGRSLMMIAAAVALFSTSAVLFRLFGDSYPGRPVLIVASAALTFIAMVTRVIVIRALQRNDKESK